MIRSVHFNASRLPQEPFSATYGDIVMVLSKCGRPIPLVFFDVMYVRCLWDIWHVVAHNQNTYQPPEVRLLDGPAFIYRNQMFYLELQQASSAVINWEYVELYCTLILIIEFAVKYRMREMDVEVVVAGIGAWGGIFRYNGPPEALQ